MDEKCLPSFASACSIVGIASSVARVEHQRRTSFSFTFETLRQLGRLQRIRRPSSGSGGIGESLHGASILDRIRRATSRSLLSRTQGHRDVYSRLKRAATFPNHLAEVRALVSDDARRNKIVLLSSSVASFIFSFRSRRASSSAAYGRRSEHGPRSRQFRRECDRNIG